MARNDRPCHNQWLEDFESITHEADSTSRKVGLTKENVLISWHFKLNQVIRWWVPSLQGRCSSQRQLRLGLEFMVGPSFGNHFFWKTALRIFMKLGNYLGIHIRRKLTRAFFEKKSGMLIKKLICAFLGTLNFVFLKLR